MPLGKLEAHTDELTGSRPLLLVCRSGARSGKACERLQQLGATYVANLAGGMIAWNRAGLPVHRRQPDSLGALVESIEAWLAQVGARHLDDVKSAIECFLADSGTSRGAPSAEATRRALDDVAAKLDAATPPPDLDLTLSAFRSDLAALQIRFDVMVVARWRLPEYIIDAWRPDES